MHSENNTVLEINGLNVRLNKQDILSDITIKVAAGDIVAVVGPNGAGKTTLFKTILGMIPYSGDIKVLGKPVKMVLDRVGYVPQRFTFDKSFPLTVWELLELSIKRGGSERIEKVLDEVEMTDHKKKLLGNLSGGQLQRVLIARAVLNQPDLLFFDEPTTGVDMEGERTFYEIIKYQNTEKNTTVLMISHEINMVYKYATQVLCLNKDLFCQGAPKIAITEEMLQKLYGEDVKLRTHKHD
ncbi:metal ABC transporter ATP-binding protein [Elusimicrobiota bacterium]